jgi:ketosteroid isomerase-like protein
MPDLHAVIDRMGQGWTGDPAAMDDLLADDVVIETPFAPGGPKRWDGREEWLAFARSGRNDLPVTLDSFTKLAVHETVDPEVAVVEYELGGVITTTGQRAAARFIGVLRVRKGKIAGWREYQDTFAIRQALG